MKVYRSNRVERLLDALVEVVAEPLADPFAPERIVVHSRGMAVWLQQQLARRLGVWAGGDFPFPRRFVHECFGAVLGDDAGSLDGFEQHILVWSIVEMLPRHLDDEAFVDLRRFLADDPRGTKSFELATRIADRFDQYVIYRPDVVLGWEAGKGDDWQAILWRSLADAAQARPLPSRPTHAAKLARALIARLHDPTFDASCLPERVCIFGVSSLPPFHVEVLGALDRHVPVHLFVPSPSREYWAEVRSHRELLRQARRGHADGFDEPPAPTLLRALGMVGRDFQQILESTVDYEDPPEDLHDEPDETTLLGVLQADLLTLRQRGGEGDGDFHVIARDDRSIAIEACHGPMREVEVLHDRIVDLLANDETLEPRDIVVMMSDVETYAPLIEAVWGGGPTPSDSTSVPYSIADRSTRGENPVVEAFHRILALVGARITASEILDLLALEVIQHRFELTASDIDTLTQWVADSGIRWGIDGTHRRAHGQPAADQNTWRFGLDRLLLGHALPGDGRETFAGVLPHDEIEGQATALLGKLAELCSRTFSLVQQLETPRPAAEWPAAFGLLIDGLLAEDDAVGTWAIEPLRAAIEAIAAEAAAAGHEDRVPLQAMCELIDARMEADRPPRGFLAGGVTFCAMLPMRTIPFRVVCLLGMGDTQFPRHARTVGFDLMRRQPRAGDRSRRADDRYLFLEALVAARDRLIITYAGQSIQDNSELPPSVVVSELLDHIAEGCVVEGAPEAAPGSEEALAAIRERLVVRHPMQPFSPRYFEADDPRLFSYASTWREGAEALRLAEGGAASREHAPLLLAPLTPVPDEARGELGLEHLVRFFRMPAVELLKRRLRVNLSDYSRDRSDREPMELDGLEEWKVGTSVIEHRLSHLPESTSLALLRARGELPLGVPGACRHEGFFRAAEPIVQAARALVAEPLANLEVDLRVGRTRLFGMLGQRHAAGIVSVQYAKLNAKTVLDAWIRHLVHGLLVDPAPPTVVITRGDKPDTATCLRLNPVDDPRPHLEDLLALYWQGQAEPLLLFPRSSLAFCQTLAAGKPLEAALDEARKEYTSRFPPEGRDPHLLRLFGDADVLAPGFRPLGETTASLDFPTVSVRVFNPILQHLEVG